MKIYVVTRGDYSDYHICGVAVDKKRAEITAKLNSDYMYTANIEEYDSEEYSGNEKKQWMVRFFVKDPPEVTKKWFDRDIMHKLPLVKQYICSHATHVAYVQADDEAHALKIAEDALAQYKAQKAGI